MVKMLHCQQFFCEAYLIRGWNTKRGHVDEHHSPRDLLVLQAIQFHVMVVTLFYLIFRNGNPLSIQSVQQSNEGGKRLAGSSATIGFKIPKI